MGLLCFLGIGSKKPNLKSTGAMYSPISKWECLMQLLRTPLRHHLCIQAGDQVCLGPRIVNVRAECYGFPLSLGGERVGVLYTLPPAKCVGLQGSGGILGKGGLLSHPLGGFLQGH